MARRTARALARRGGGARTSVRGRIDELGAFPIPGVGTRRVRVYVPPNAAPGTPVLYLWDGQNVFGDEGSFAGGWLVHDVLDRRAARRRATPIVVALDHGGEQRILELTPWPTRRGEGQLDGLLDWLLGTLKPMVDGRFPTDPRREATFIGGSSMGGLAALYGLLRHPPSFVGALCMSPALWIAGARIFALAAEHPPHPSARVYLDCGVREGRGRMHDQARRLAQLLTERGLEPGRGVLFRSDPRGAHREACWRRRLPLALRFLFRDPDLGSALSRLGRPVRRRDS